MCINIYLLKDIFPVLSILYDAIMNNFVHIWYYLECILKSKIMGS